MKENFILKIYASSYRLEKGWGGGVLYQFSQPFYTMHFICPTIQFQLNICGYVSDVTMYPFENMSTSQ